jgi:HflC protein
MKKLALPLILISGAVLFVLASSTLFIVPQTKSALVLQFGKVVTIHQEPGLKVKLPFVQDVIKYDNRLLAFDLPAFEVNASDQKRYVVDLYVRYKISDPLQFYKSIGVDIALVEQRLTGIVLDNMQEVIARFPPEAMRSSKRSEIMQEIYGKVKVASEKYGITVIDVRIIRADLPKENSEAVFNRMESERVQAAKHIRAQGEEAAATVRAQADRDRTVILAEARKAAEILRGEGEAIATKIYADAYNKDRRFYEVYRSLDAYINSLTPETTTMILSSKDSDFFKHFSVTTK